VWCGGIGGEESGLCCLALDDTNHWWLPFVFLYQRTNPHCDLTLQGGIDDIRNARCVDGSSKTSFSRRGR